VIFARRSGWSGEMSPQLTRRNKMNRPTKRGLIGVLLATALGALALAALTGGAAARSTDSNRDRIPDRWEKRHHLSLKVNQARRDQDRDHLRNRAEFLAGDNPRSDDSDGDGVIDGDEQAGTIASFDASSGRLAIDLFGSDTISGLVTADTEIKCEGAEHHHNRGEGRHGRDNSGRGSQSGDDNGGGEPEPGDDKGGGEEPGDDNGGGSASTCGTAALEPGAVVQEAELRVQNGKAAFEEVELAH
jgi:hypothetical protein